MSVLIAANAGFSGTTHAAFLVKLPSAQATNVTQLGIHLGIRVSHLTS